jgi:CheY-like chemotaxis protein
MSISPKKILIVDDHADGRFLLVKTIHRKLPESLVQECGDATTAIYSVEHDRPDAVIVHRAGEIDGLSMVRLLRRVDGRVPIVYVSGYDREREALEAGANQFLNYDAWLNIGTIVAQILHRAPGRPHRDLADASAAWVPQSSRQPFGPPLPAPSHAAFTIIERD